jgi:hypothetical protein
MANAFYQLLEIASVTLNLPSGDLAMTLIKNRREKTATVFLFFRVIKKPGTSLVAILR